MFHVCMCFLVVLCGVCGTIGYFHLLSIELQLNAKPINNKKNMSGKVRHGYYSVDCPKATLFMATLDLEMTCSQLIK